jgi:predicted ATP-grasp superfamily ATP-dependent carboligase
MNMFHTGLGIARSLGERGIPVIGLSSRRGVYGNSSRYAKTLICPDSRSEPEALAVFLAGLGRTLGRRAVLFPTRDDDLVFMDRFRRELERYFSIVVADSEPLSACLDKWQTALWAERTGAPAPKTWIVRRRQDLDAIVREASYPCVLKPLAAHHWRSGEKWQVVGARKAIAVHSERELRAEYDVIARADERALLQEMIPGGDENLVIAACYFNRESHLVAGFNVRKLVQVPEGLGTGCIVESVQRPELFGPAERLLSAMGFSGVAEVEFKWDAAAKQYKLIEVNPRPWDQHRLGKACGVDVIYAAYCEHAGLPTPEFEKPRKDLKWIAEDTFFMTSLRMLWRRDRRVFTLWRQARGKRIYAIWSWRDPLPLIAHVFGELIPGLLAGGFRRVINWAMRAIRPPLHQEPRRSRV